MSKPTASLSLDLDNKWTYLRTHGVEGWQEYPSYLPLVANRVTQFLGDFNVRSTVFVVGRDLESAVNRDAVAQFSDGGHEIGNHSYWHYPWIDRLESDALVQEIADTEMAIEALTGERPYGFRAPGFSGAPHVLELLAQCGYHYDASTFPTVIGPLAAWYARARSFGSASDDERQRFATFRDGFGPLRPHAVTTPAGTLVEMPVTTLPILRLPIHVTYLMYLRQFSKRLASIYLRWSLRICSWRGVAPSVLLHPLDFLGGEEEPDLSFFPGMKVARQDKLSLLNELIVCLTDRFSVTTVGEHARAACPALPFTQASAPLMATAPATEVHVH